MTQSDLNSASTGHGAMGAVAMEIEENMVCALLKAPKEVQISQMPVPRPKAGQVLIKVDMAALCGSDAAMYQGKYQVTLPIIPGHEAIGRVAGLGAGVTSLQPGQRVVVVPNYGCGTCFLCKKGLSNICASKVRIGIDCHGVLAGYTLVPDHCLVKVPDELEDEKAVFTEPAAVACHGFKKAKPEEGQKVLVIGAGVIGLLMIQLAQADGAAVSALDLVPQRLELAKSLGAVSGHADLQSCEENGPYDVIFDTSGAPGALDSAIKVAAGGARIVVLGLSAAGHEVQSSMVVRKELRIMGSMIYTDEFAMAIELLQKGVIRTEKMISSIHPLEGLAADLEGFSDPGRVKSLIDLRRQ